MAHFNGLTPAEDERLALVAEEAAEVIVAVMKIQRHGFDSHNPMTFDGPFGGDNRGDLAKEIGHFRHAVARLIDAGDVDEEHVQDSQGRKAGTIARWLHHQEAR